MRRPQFRPSRYMLPRVVLGALGGALALAREIAYGVILPWDSIPTDPPCPASQLRSACSQRYVALSRQPRRERDDPS